jgi:hypothetical protein
MLIGKADIENGSPFFGRPVRATLGFFLRPWSGVGGTDAETPLASLRNPERPGRVSCFRL